MMQPKRTKYRKRHKGRNDGLTKRGAELNFGSYGMKATTNARVTARQIEAARRAITRHLKRAGRTPEVWASIISRSCDIGSWPRISPLKTHTLTPHTP